jgi:hypothetical protein
MLSCVPAGASTRPTGSASKIAAREGPPVATVAAAEARYSVSAYVIAVPRGTDASGARRELMAARHALTSAEASLRGWLFCGGASKFKRVRRRRWL